MGQVVGLDILGQVGMLVLVDSHHVVVDHKQLLVEVLHLLGKLQLVQDRYHLEGDSLVVLGTHDAHRDAHHDDLGVHDVQAFPQDTYPEKKSFLSILVLQNKLICHIHW